MEEGGRILIQIIWLKSEPVLKGNRLFCFIKLNSLAEELDKINVRLKKKEK